VTRLLLFLVAAVGLLALVFTKAEPFAPTAELATPVDVVGHATPIHLVARDRGTGLAHVEVRLVGSGDAPPVVVAERDFPKVSWNGSGRHEATLDLTLDAARAKLPEGPAELQVWVRDYSWLAGFRRGPRLTQRVIVDLTAPTLEVLSQQHVVRLGGSECAVYKVGSDTAESGVAVGGEFFPGDALFTDRALRAALFAVPQDSPLSTAPNVVVSDPAGNKRTTKLDVDLRSRRFAEKTLPLSDDFLAKKVPDLLQANGLDPSGDLVEGYLRINRELRATTEERVRAICRESAPEPLWQGAFLRLPDSAPLSGFADRRTYLYRGNPIDHQTHLGFDLASLRGAVIPAGNTGVVAFAGALGIYGNTVILDHGIGLFSLYGHLSEVSVAKGARVARGDPIGKTGDTGLAGGDHLHFSIMVRGVHVDPVEWWDAHWIHDHIEARLATYPRAPAGGSP
jgi:murein DD-endopeptidase MepM/ murein hydrolase activator NlpD